MRRFLATLLLCPVLLSAAPAPERLWPDSAVTSEITVHRPAVTNGTAVVICPGGGYGGLMMSYEGHDVAAWLNQQGVTAVVLKYRVAPHHHPEPWQDGQRALRTVRARAAALGVKPDRIGMMGFSAGGHLAATVGTLFDDGNPTAADPVERVSSRPDFLLLVYPVISLGPQGHAGSRKNLLGENPPAELVDLLSTERQVTDRTPPAFLAHARTDTVVPIENSLLFAAALKAHGVANEVLELPTGAHGLGVGKGELWAQWQAACLKWMKGQWLL